MSWWAGRSLTWFQDFAINVVKCGHLPQHVAFIMDGNRRYARKKNMKLELGHLAGAEKLKELTYWCKEIGIPEITVYGFSIENFKRNAEEVDALLNLTRTQFSDVLERLADFMKDDIRIRAFGNLDLLPNDLKKIIAKIVLMTKHNKTLIVNFALSYTSRDEMTSAIKTVVQGVRSGSLETTDIDEEFFSACMFTNHSRDPEVLVRTSGETRFSDFLLWQIQNTTVYFVNVMWPEFGFWNFLKIVFLYQRTCDETQTSKLNLQAKQPSARKEQFLKDLDKTRMRVLEQYVNNIF